MDTVTMVKEVGFETIFAFKYSPRPFTKAAKFEEQVDEETKTRRLNYLFDEHDKMAFELVKRYEGQTMKVLVENVDREDGKIQGRSTGNKLVHFLGPKDLIGKTVDVKIIKAFPATFRGELV
jgi:tRNA-2-methylthio-N6-dimethylallyladenosine synthase